jgi:hypothetical protein
MSHVTTILLVNALLTGAFVAVFAASVWGALRLLGDGRGPDDGTLSIDEDQLADSA